MKNENMVQKGTQTVADAAAAVRASRYALKYHIAPPAGWMNDPNGLVKCGGKYHVFYQHYPYKPVWGPMHWGHALSDDLVHWKHLPIAIAPDMPYEDGCFSGSAVDDNGVLTLIYTAHRTDPVHQSQCVARSFDGGSTFVKSALNPVIPEPPEGCAVDFRDPKVWKQDGRWNLVAGTVHDGKGCVALYSSDDLEHWEYRGIMCESDGTLGSMWECPSFCRVDGQDIMIVSPMKMPGHKNIAMFGEYDNVAGRMRIDSFRELGLGEDFYAAQVFCDGDRTLLFGWMDMWGKNHPTESDGWAGALTIPRELSIRNGRLIQSPARELCALREEILLDDCSAESLSELRGDCMELFAELNGSTALTIGDSDEWMLRASFDDGTATFALPNGRVASETVCGAIESIRVFVDACSVEIFVNGGEVCFSQRVYPNADGFRYSAQGGVKRITAWNLRGAIAEGIG